MGMMGNVVTYVSGYLQRHTTELSIQKMFKNIYIWKRCLGLTQTADSECIYLSIVNVIYFIFC